MIEIKNRSDKVKEVLKGDKNFEQILKRVVQCDYKFRECGDISKQCVNRKTGVLSISKEYVVRHMLKRTTVVLYTSGTAEVKTRRGTIEETVFTGFLLGHVKTINKKKVFYIDLVCSAHRQGRNIMMHAEKVARRMKCETIALRAAYRKLIPIYNRLKYKQMGNACDYEKDKRADRRLRKRLNKGFIEFSGRTPVKGSGHGWWMSKCLK